MENKKSFGALLPIAVFVFLYLGLGITLEYIMDVPMGFYNVSVVVVFMIALLVACIQANGINMNEKLKIMANSMADPNIITMILIFLMAGVFVGVLGRSSAETLGRVFNVEMSEVLVAAVAVVVGGGACPQRLLVELHEILSNAAVNHGTELSVADGQGIFHPGVCGRCLGHWSRVPQR